MGNRGFKKHFFPKGVGLFSGLGWLATVAVLALLAMQLVDGRDKPDRLRGRAYIVDGDSLNISGNRVRLIGIDAPEGRQTCNLSGRSWACGQAATRKLRALIADAVVTCTADREDQHGRLLAVCFAGGRNLNAAMVRSGYAVSYGRYRDLEADARQARRGIWASRFTTPRKWRRVNRGR